MTGTLKYYSPSSCTSSNIYEIILTQNHLKNAIEALRSSTPLVYLCNSPLHLILQSRSTGNNLNELGGNASLASPIVLQGELLDHLPGVLGGVLHGIHPGGLLGSGGLHHGVVQLGGHHHLCQILHDLLLGVWLHLVLGKALVLARGLERGHGLQARVVRDGRQELVEDDVDGIKLPNIQRLSSNRRNSGEVDGRGEVAGNDLHAVPKLAAEDAAPLLPNHTELGLLPRCVDSFHHLTQVPADHIVHTSAQAAVGSDGDDQVLLGQPAEVHVLHGHPRPRQPLRPGIKWSCVFQSLLVPSQLGSGNHFHRRCDFADILSRLNPVKNLLLSGKPSALHPAY
mmetsp:Transcript_15885/g.23360  ORF Transcript_15885/g.23360 Transcript_15885/m.23360 type:complete len:340 (+) Transcript_15885:51-1070(+)